MKIRKWLTIAAVAIAAVVSLSIIYENVSSPPVGVNQGMQAPDFTLERGDVEGEKMSLKDQEDQFVILNLWASWCEPCIEELPLLSEMHTSYKDDGVVVLAVNMTTYERQIDNAFEFLDEHPVEMPILMDYDGEFLATYPLQALPTTYLINEDGVIVDIIVGELTDEMVERRITPFIDQRTA
ncbi:hypothetical protein DH09_07060 [Bacillaceae bacterium JMAK1]|nr:hypothetical protein DH09_07060 [Bacillaceae bacterium JMAK1]